MTGRYVARRRPLRSYHPASAIEDYCDLAILPPTPEEDGTFRSLGLNLKDFIKESAKDYQTESKPEIKNSISL